MNFKLLGERAEAIFMSAALEHGFAIAKPWGDSLPYDFILDTSPVVRPGRLFRVQVRSVRRKGSGKYQVSGRRSHYGPPLTPEDIDLLTAYVIPYWAWYLIPVSAFAPRQRLCLFTHVANSRGLWERYREAWKEVLRS